MTCLAMSFQQSSKSLSCVLTSLEAGSSLSMFLSKSSPALWRDCSLIPCSSNSFSTPYKHKHLSQVGRVDSLCQIEIFVKATRKNEGKKKERQTKKNRSFVTVVYTFPVYQLQKTFYLAVCRHFILTHCTKDY